jgi:DNA polymerase III delta prime subunit
MSYSFPRITTYEDSITRFYNPDDKFFVERVWLVKKIEQFKQNPKGRHLIIVGEPGSGKSTFMAYLAQYWNCPRHFIRVENKSDASDVDTRSFLVSLGAQLYQKYGQDIFDQNISDTTVRVNNITENTEIVGRFTKESYTLPFLPKKVNVLVEANQVSGHSKVTGEKIGKQLDSSKQLDESTLLHVAVLDPIRKIQEIYPDETVVILVDALDESLQHTGKRIIDIIPLATDAGFPKNLRLVMTSRQGNYLVRFQPDDLLFLKKNVEQGGYRQEVLKDAQTYIKRRTAEEPLSGIIEALPPHEKKSYITEIEQKSDGNFLYLYYFFNQVVEIIEEDKTNLRETNLREIVIPKGLDGIYRFFVVARILKSTPDSIKFTVRDKIPDKLVSQWQEIDGIYKITVSGYEVTVTLKNADKALLKLSRAANKLEVDIDEDSVETQKGTDIGTLEEKYLPILGVLAVAKEALNQKQLAGFSNVEDNYVDSIVAKLKQFLDEFEEKEENRYRFYHISLNEYLLDSSRNRDYRLDEAKYHSKIASYYKKESESWENINLTNIDEYGFLYLTKHLNAGGMQRQEELYVLLTGSPKWMEAKSNNLGNAAYVDDLELAINNFNDPLEEANQLVTLVKLYTALQVVNQRVSIPNLKTLVCLGRKTEALSHARLMSDAKNKFDALMTIHNALKEKKQLDNNLLNEAEKIAEGIGKDSLNKAEALIELAVALIEAKYGDKAKAVLHQAAEVVEKIPVAYYKAKTLIKLINALACTDDFTEVGKVVAQAQEVTKIITSYRYKAEMLVELAAALVKIGCREKAKLLFEEAQNVINKDKDIWRLTDVLLKLAIAMNHATLNSASSLFNKVEQIADEVSEGIKKANILIDLAVALAQTGFKSEAKIILDKVKIIDLSNVHNEYKLILETQLAIALGLTGFFSEAKILALNIKQRTKQVEVLSKLAVIANTKDANESKYFLNKAHEIAHTIESESDKLGALSKLIEALEEVNNFKKVEEIATEFNKIRYVVEKDFQSEVLTKLGTILANAHYEEDKVSVIFREAEKAAQSLTENLRKGEALSKLAIALVRSGREARLILTDIDKIIDDILCSKEHLTIGDNQGGILIDVAYFLAIDKNFLKLEEIANAIQNSPDLKAEILSLLVEGLAKAEKFSEAEEVVQKIEKNSVKASAVSKIAVEVAKTNINKARNIFSEAKKIAFALQEYEYINIVIELVADLVSAGELNEAKNIVNLVKDDYLKAMGLSKLAKGYAQIKDFDEANNVIKEAKKVSNQIRTSAHQSMTKTELALTLAQIKLFKEAFNVFSNVKTSSKFLIYLMEFESSFEKIKSGLTTNILQSAIHILAWKDPNCIQIDEMFCSKSKLL